MHTLDRVKSSSTKSQSDVALCVDEEAMRREDPLVLEPLDVELLFILQYKTRYTLLCTIRPYKIGSTVPWKVSMNSGAVDGYLPDGQLSIILNFLSKLKLQTRFWTRSCSNSRGSAECGEYRVCGASVTKINTDQSYLIQRLRRPGRGCTMRLMVRPMKAEVRISKP